MTQDIKMSQNYKAFKIMQDGAVWYSHTLAKAMGINYNLTGRIFGDLEWFGYAIQVQDVIDPETQRPCKAYKLINPEMIYREPTEEEKRSKPKKLEPEIEELLVEMVKLMCQKEIVGTELQRVAIFKNFSQILYLLNDGCEITQLKVKNHLKSNAMHTVKENALTILRDITRILE